MRNLGIFALLLAAACGGSTASSETTPTPASSPATTANAGPSPCSGGDCTVSIDVGSDIETEFARRQANYKVYQGCPRTLGVSNPSGLRSLQPLSSSRTPSVSVPGSMTGRYATVAVFFGASPERYVVVDFGANKNQTVNFGYRWEGNALANDLTIVNTNNSFINRVCR